jgi:hypothetical protein
MMPTLHDVVAEVCRLFDGDVVEVRPSPLAARKCPDTLEDRCTCDHERVMHEQESRHGWTACSLKGCGCVRFGKRT